MPLVYLPDRNELFLWGEDRDVRGLNGLAAGGQPAVAAVVAPGKRGEVAGVALPLFETMIRATSSWTSRSLTPRPVEVTVHPIRGAPAPPFESAAQEEWEREFHAWLQAHDRTTPIPPANRCVEQQYTWSGGECVLRIDDSRMHIER